MIIYLLYYYDLEGFEGTAGYYSSQYLAYKYADDLVEQGECLPGDYWVEGVKVLDD